MHRFPRVLIPLLLLLGLAAFGCAGDRDPDGDADTDTDVDSDSDSDSDSDTESGSGTDTETDSDSETDSESDTGSDSETESDSETDTETDSDSETDSESDTDDGSVSCAGALTELELDTPAEGDTSGAPSDMNPSEDCSWSEGQPNVVYALSVPGPGALTVHLDVPDVDVDGAADWDSVVSLRTSCSDPTSEIACNDDYWGGDLLASRVSLCVVEAQDLIVVVDGYSQETDNYGPFTVTASLESCAEGEVCVPGGGCVPQLQGGETCDVPVALPLNSEIAGVTTGMTDDVQAQCSAGDGPDAVYSVDLPSAGILQADLSVSDFDATVLVRTACPDAQTELGCGLYGVETCLPAGVHSLVVDGEVGGWLGEAEGSFILTNTFTPCIEDEACFGSFCAVPLQGGDSCDSAIDLPLNTRVGGDTTALADDIRGTCTGGDGPDMVYTVDLPSEGVFGVELAASFDGSILLRSSCAEEEDARDCSYYGLQRCLPAGPYSVIVDGETGGWGEQAAGSFILTNTFVPCAEGQSCFGGQCIVPAGPEIEPNDAFATAQELEDGARIGGLIEAVGAADFYALELLQDQVAHIDLGEGCAMDTIVFVYGDPLPDETPNETYCGWEDPAPALACNDDNAGLCSSIDFTAPADGTYYLRVIDYGSNDEGGQYILNVDIE